MHELGLADGILSVTREIAGERRVRRVRVRIGALQRVAPDSLEFGFQLLAADTPAADARLEVIDIAARLRCPSCRAESAGRGGADALVCATCGAPGVEVIGGDEVLVDEIELDGTPPEVVRRPGLAVSEPDDHSHAGTAAGDDDSTHAHAVTGRR